MIKNVICYIVFSIFICSYALAQNKCLIDSMLPILNASKEDTIKVITLLKVCNSCKESQTDKALTLCLKAEALAKQLQFNRLDADIYVSIADCYDLKQNSTEALTYYYKSLHIAEKQKNNAIIFRCYNALGNIHINENNYTLAKGFYLNAYKYTNNDKRSERAILANLGLVEGNLGNYDKAKIYLLKGIDLCKRYNDEKMLAYFLNTLGVNHTDTKKYAEAIGYLTESLRLNIKFSDSAGVAYDYVALGNVYYQLHNYTEAVKCYTNALKNTESIKERQLISATYEKLSYISAERGDYKSAFNYHKLFKKITDSLFTEEKSNQIAEMNVKYETDKKDNQINTLKTEYILKEAIAKRQTWIIAICVVAVFIFIMLSTSLVNNIRKRNTAYHILQEKNNLILEQNKKIEHQKKALESYTTELEQENILAQFETLKNQVNPHFLFNSLGALSSLIKKDPKQAYLFTKEFTKIYRVVLELKEHALIYLSEELDFTESYLFLQKIRFSKSLVVNNHIPNEYFYYAVPPFSLQLLLENTIKHNIISEQQPLEISIYIEDDFLIVKNTIQLRANKNTSTKIGNKNLIDRYKILSDKAPLFYQENGYYYAKIPLLKNAMNT